MTACQVEIFPSGTLHAICCANQSELLPAIPNPSPFTHTHTGDVSGLMQSRQFPAKAHSHDHKKRRARSLSSCTIVSHGHVRPHVTLQFTSNEGSSSCCKTVGILRKVANRFSFLAPLSVFWERQTWCQTFESVTRNCRKVLPPPKKNQQTYPVLAVLSGHCVKGYLACDNLGVTPNEVTAVIPGKGYFKVGGGGVRLTYWHSCNAFLKR